LFPISGPTIEKGTVQSALISMYEEGNRQEINFSIIRTMFCGLSL